MSSAALPSASAIEATPRAIPLRQLAPWLVFAGLIMLMIAYFVTAEQNAWVHEWMHDGRHLLGFPCH